MTTYTPSGRLWKGTPFDPSIKGAWGPPINTNCDLVEAMILGTATIDLTSQSTPFTVPTASGAADNARELVQSFIGTLTGNMTVVLPNVPKIGYFRNTTTGGFTLTVNAGAGTSVTVPADGTWYFYWADGSTNLSLPSVQFGLLPVPATVTNTGRNLVFNGQFQVSQRGAGPFTTNGVVGLDGYRNFTTNDTISITQVALSDSDRAAIGDEAASVGLKNVFTGSATAGSFNLIRHAIEDVRRLTGKTVTISFWAIAASGTPKLGISFVTFFGTGGSGTVVTAGQAVTLSTSWARYSKTFSIASSSGATVVNADSWAGPRIWYSAEATNGTESGGIGVQSGTITIWGVQVEASGSATALEKRPFAEETIRAQRYYQTGAANYFGSATAGSISLVQGITLPVTMRANPTMTSNFTTTTNTSGATVSVVNFGYVQISATSVGSGGFGLIGTFTAAAEV